MQHDNKDTKKEYNDFDEQGESLTSHLIELRQRIIYILIGVVAIFLICLPFSQTLFEQFAQPVLRSLSATENLIIRRPLDSFLIPLKLCLFLSILFSLPWILYQIWGFVAPGLYRKEKNIVMPLIF